MHHISKGETLDNEKYINFCLGPAIKEVIKQRPSSGTRSIKLLQDNVRPHVHSNVYNFLQSNGIQIIDHPPYSPDLAPCDYWLFDYIKQRLGDQKDEDSLHKSITKILKSIPHQDYIKKFKKYIERLEYCINVENKYFEYLMK